MQMLVVQCLVASKDEALWAEDQGPLEACLLLAAAWSQKSVTRAALCQTVPAAVAEVGCVTM